MERFVGVQTASVSYHRYLRDVRCVGHVVSLGHVPPQLDSRLSMVLPAVTERRRMSVHGVYPAAR